MKNSHSHCKMLYCTTEGFKAQKAALMHSKQLYCTTEGFTKESFTAQQTTSMHSRKLYCTAGSFIAQQKVLLHSRKVSPAAETGEKFLLRQKLEKSFFCGKNREQAPHPTRRKRAPGKRGIVCAQAGPNWVAVGLLSTPLLKILGPNTAGGSPAHFNHKKAHCIKMATPLGNWDQNRENEIFLPHKHVSKSLPKQDMQMFLNLSSYTLRKVSKTS